MACDKEQEVDINVNFRMACDKEQEVDIYLFCD